MVTLITCTGDRPICFELLECWINRQSIKPDQWIVVDDGRIPTIPKISCEYIRREPNKSDPKFTMLLNLDEAFKHIKGDKILFIEDDEYYASDYIKNMTEKLDRYDLAGIGRSKYYYLPTLKWYRHKNMGHASLAQTGFNSNFLRDAKSCLKGDLFLDIRFWRKMNGTGADFLSLPEVVKFKESANKKGFVFEDYENSLYCGMKGMPGREGIGIGHNERSCYYPDKDNRVLKSWIATKDDYNKYLKVREELS